MIIWSFLSSYVIIIMGIVVGETKYSTFYHPNREITKPIPIPRNIEYNKTKPWKMIIPHSYYCYD